jgi:hypothetical protein
MNVLFITSIITSVFSGIVGAFIGLKVKLCRCCCITSECSRTPPQTPIEK